MDLARYEPAFGGADSVRFVYLRLPVLRKAMEDDRLVDSLVRELEVPGKPAVLKALSRAQKIEAIDDQIKHLTSSKNSGWYGVSPPEVLAAAIFRSSMPDRYVVQLFAGTPGKSANEHALLSPISVWLRARGMHVFDEVCLGANRVDALGYKKGGWLTSTELIAVELKDDLAQMKRGLDQMATFGEYVHKVYLACTPFLAADFLDQHYAGAKVKHWDPDLLDRKLQQVGVGLLLVEGDQVYEHRAPRARSPEEKKLEEVELALKGR